MYLNVTRMHYHRSQNVTHLAENQKLKETFLAPTGALVLMMVYYISAAAATFSDFEHLCLSILLQVSLYVA